MKINIHSVNIEIDKKLKELIELKISKLSNYHDKIISADVYLKLDNVVHHIKDKVVEIKLHIPKNECFVKTISKSLEISFDEALTSITNQLKKKKLKAEG